MTIVSIVQLCRLRLREWKHHATAEVGFYIRYGRKWSLYKQQFWHDISRGVYRKWPADELQSHLDRVMKRSFGARVARIEGKPAH